MSQKILTHTRTFEGYLRTQYASHFEQLSKAGKSPFQHDLDTIRKVTEIVATPDKKELEAIVGGVKLEDFKMYDLPPSVTLQEIYRHAKNFYEAAGFTIRRFNPERECLVMEKDGHDYDVVISLFWDGPTSNQLMCTILEDGWFRKT